MQLNHLAMSKIINFDLNIAIRTVCSNEWARRISITTAHCSISKNNKIKNDSVFDFRSDL